MEDLFKYLLAKSSPDISTIRNRNFYIKNKEKEIPSEANHLFDDSEYSDSDSDTLTESDSESLCGPIIFVFINKNKIIKNDIFFMILRILIP